MTMTLAGFDRQLCGYVLGNVESLATSPKRFDLIAKNLGEGPLLEYLKVYIDPYADAESLLLDDDELELLQEACSGESQWEVDDRFRRWEIDTFAEVRVGIGEQAARNWLTACGEFDKKLTAPRLHIAEGIEVVREWIGRLRALLRAMGKRDSLPCPEGTSATPTCRMQTQPLQEPLKQELPVPDSSARLETMLATLVERATVRDWYSVEQFAELVKREPYTVREWCRLGRVRAEKKQSGRGKYPLWVISHDEVLRYEREGLLAFVKN
jgi:hypothetical protein